MGQKETELKSAGMNRIMICGPRNGGTYIIEFKMAAGEALAISVPAGETRVLKLARRFDRPSARHGRPSAGSSHQRLSGNAFGCASRGCQCNGNETAHTTIAFRKITAPARNERAAARLGVHAAAFATRT
jgi:hypothetical protein